ncbi:unnamed protein product [Effrenium voratum]|nr:unnamed protein product [Effrenium voratum]
MSCLRHVRLLVLLWLWHLSRLAFTGLAPKKALSRLLARAAEPQQITASIKGAKSALAILELLEEEEEHLNMFHVTAAWSKLSKQKLTNDVISGPKLAMLIEKTTTLLQRPSVGPRAVAEIFTAAGKMHGKATARPLRSLWALLAEKAQTVAAEMDDQSVSQAMFAWVLASDGTSLPVLTPLLPVLAHRAAEAMPQMRAAGVSKVTWSLAKLFERSLSSSESQLRRLVPWTAARLEEVAEDLNAQGPIQA